MGDVMSVLLSDDPGLGYGFYGDCGTPLRNADNTLQYPCTDAIHYCGQLLSGCVWDLRNELVAVYPNTYMDTVANLAINAMLVHTGDLITPQIAIDYLTLDDDDANLDNGSPNWDYICAAFEAHNMDCPELLPIGFVYPDGRPDIIDPLSETLVRVNVGGLAGQPQPGTAELYYSIDGAPFVSGTVTEVAPNEYDLHLPAIDCLSRLDWYMTAMTSDLQVIYNPSDAPTTTYGTIAATATVAELADSFETDLGWTVQNSGGLVDGAWERGTPVGGGDRGDPPTDYDGSGQCYLTDNVDGNSDVDDGTTMLISPTIDLSSGNAKINYARWYSNNQGAAPNSDSMEIWISNDNGLGWVKVEAVGPVEQATGGWYTHEFWVGDLIAPTAQMKLRFDASDLGSGSVVEAAVDAVTVTTYQCEQPFICGDTNGDGNVNVTDAVMLIAFVFGDGPAPEPIEVADVDCDGEVNVSDVVSLLNYIFSDGVAPCAEC
jgi:hypothetical protein